MAQRRIGKTHDVPALISKAAHEGKAPICDQTMSLFVPAIQVPRPETMR